MTETTIVSPPLPDALERADRRIADLRRPFASALQAPRGEELPVPAREALLADAATTATELRDLVGKLDGLAEELRWMR